jgi:hypothetical protein
MKVENVLEYWPLYDSVLIGIDAVEKWPNAGFFTGYRFLGMPAEIPFFNIRNKSQIGLPYNNFDTKDILPFVYHCDSIGVEWVAAPSAGSNSGITGKVQDLAFAKLIAYHSSLSLTLNQDEKIVCSVPLLPAGMGIAGDADDGGTTNHQNSMVNISNNGSAVLTNRYEFPEPLLFPRDVTFNAVLKFSKYARAVLEQLPAPIGETVSDGNPHNNFAMIRVSLFGRREVQQRGQLHFSGGPIAEEMDV